MKQLYLVLLLSLITSIAAAQTTLGFQGFESSSSDTWSFTPSPAAFTPNSSGDYWGIQPSIGGISPSATGGATLWAIQDLNNNDGGAGSGTLSFPAINTSGYSNFTISFDYHVDGFDNGDDIDVEITIDGTTQPIENVVDGFSNFSSVGWETYTFTWNPAATSISLDIIVSQNGDGDQGAIDNVSLTGVVSSGCVISSIAVQNQSGCNDNSTPGDNSDDFYTADITVNFLNKPAGGTLDLAGDISSPQSVAVGSTTTANSHTFMGVQIPANGATGDLTASFSADGTCTRTESNVLPVVSPCSGGTDFLIFSEYIESGNQKYLEIHNPSLTTVSLASYQILIYANGSVTPTTTINFTGASISPGGYYVLEHNQASTPVGVTPDQVAFLGYNGNDAIVLSDGGVIRDAIGQIGNTPAGGSWSSGSCDTQDQTLRKNAGLGDATADSNPNDAYDPAVHWQSCLSSIDYTNLGVGFVFPVELISFEAEKTDDGVLLHWSTASERDNAGFEIYRWSENSEELLGTVKGQGTAFTLSQYSFPDLLPLQTRTVYRLVQIDLDGTKTLVGLAELSFDGQGQSGVSLSPNPVNDRMTILFTGNHARPGKLIISGMRGETLLAHQIDILEGMNEMDLNVSNLPAGVYMIQIIGTEGQIVKRFIKQ